MSSTLSWDDLTEDLRREAQPARVAAAAGGAVLLIGPPGAGRTMIARRLLLTPVPQAMHRDVFAIHRMAGLAPPSSCLLSRPFRAPHHTCSTTGLVGSGKSFRPGELSLAHGGTLFLDEVTEFSNPALEAVAMAYSHKVVQLRDSTHLVSLPADFTLVAAALPCPCGYLGSKSRLCVCSARAITAHRKRLHRLKYDCIVELSGK